MGNITTTARFCWKAPDGREQVFLISSPEIRIGRKVDADLVLPLPQVSRRHATVVTVPQGHELVDEGSAGGTFVNGKRIQRQLLRHGDRVGFGRTDGEFEYTVGEAEPQHDQDAARIVQKSFRELSRVLPSAASDLEKILCVLDFQYQWNEVFTPETSLDHILESTLRVSGAERAFIMTRKGDGFGYATGMDRKGNPLWESHFQTSQTLVREVLRQQTAVYQVEGIDDTFEAHGEQSSTNLRASACLPLHGITTEEGEQEILGVLYLDSTEATHTLSGLDQVLLNKLAAEAGGVLERVEMIKSIEQRKKMERDLALAEETQRSLLPHEIPDLPHLKLFAFCEPTRYVGGDFYDFQVMKSGDLIGLLADISGKGVAASVLSSMILGCLQLLLRAGTSPKDALSQMNKFLLEKSSGRFATIFLFSVHPSGAARFISAGHNPAYIYRAATGEIEELMSNNLILGMFDFAGFDATPFDLHTDDILLVYSDGLTEAASPSNEMFGEERLKEIIRRDGPAGAEKLNRAILEAVRGFSADQPPTDDITLIVAQYTGTPEGALNV